MKLNCTHYLTVAAFTGLAFLFSVTNSHSQSKQKLSKLTDVFPIILSIKQSDHDEDQIIIRIKNAGSKPVFIVNDVAKKIQFNISFIKDGELIDSGYEFLYASSPVNYKIQNQIPLIPNQEYSFTVPIADIFFSVKRLGENKLPADDFSIQAYVDSFFGSNKDGFLDLSDDLIASNILKIQRKKKTVSDQDQ